MSPKAKKAFTLWFLFVLCFVPAFMLTLANLQLLGGPKYEEVLVRVVSVEDGEVRVSHDGREYRLNIGDGAWSDDDIRTKYKAGATMSVYRARGGRLYAEPGMIPPASVLKIAVYLAFVLSAAAFLIAALFSTVRKSPAKKAAKSPPKPSVPRYDPEIRK